MSSPMSTKPLVTNAAHEEKHEKAKDVVAQNERTLRDAYKKLLATPEGRLLLWDLLDHCGVYRSIFEPNSRISYNAGKQDVGHYVQAQIVEADPSAMITMMQSKLTK